MRNAKGLEATTGWMQVIFTSLEDGFYLPYEEPHWEKGSGGQQIHQVSAKNPGAPLPVIS